MAMKSGGKSRTVSQVGWVLRRELEVDVVMSRRAVGEAAEAAQRRLQGLCACCQRSFRAERLVRGMCDTCREHAHCAKCEQTFQVTKDSFGRVCGSCWRELSSDAHLATRLEQGSRDSVAKELNRLAFGRVSACATAATTTTATTNKADGKTPAEPVVNKSSTRALTTSERARRFELARAAMR